MRSTTLLLPLIILLSSVLAVPTPVWGQIANVTEDCGVSISMEECNIIHTDEEDATRMPDDTVLTPN